MPDTSLADVQSVRPAPAAARARATIAIDIAPLEASARFSLRLRLEAGERAPCAPLSLDIPINTCAIADCRTLARLGPDEWLLLGPHAQSAQLAWEMNKALAGRFFSLVDISDANAVVAVRGRRAREVINGGCPLDLHDDRFPPESATRTVLGKAEIILFRLTAEAAYQVQCCRSFAPYVHAFLKHVAREFEAE